MPRFTGAELIVVERIRQVEEEGYDAEHDSGNSRDLARAASCYAQPWVGRTLVDFADGPGYIAPKDWPWAPGEWMPTPLDRVRELVKAGALIAAAIDSLLEETDASN